jgi:hypothetical protein
MMRWTWLTFLFLISCRELIQDTFEDYPPVPIVNGILEAGKPAEVVLALTGKLDTASLQRVTDAEIALMMDNGPLETLIFVDSLESYRSMALIEAGHDYTLMISIDGFDPITVSQHVPLPTPIVSLAHIDVAGKDEEGRSYSAVLVEFANDPDQRSYHEILMHLIEQEQVSLARPEAITDPVLLSEGLPLVLFGNEQIDGDGYTMQINYSTGTYELINGNAYQVRHFPIIVELRTVSEDYYRYARQHYLYNQGRYPMIVGGVVTNFNLYSNVPGATGIVSSLSTFQSDTLYPASYQSN